MGTVEKFLILLFTAIIFGLILTNPRGVAGFFSGIAQFTSQTVGAFTGFAGRSSGFSPTVGSGNIYSPSVFV